MPGGAGSSDETGARRLTTAGSRSVLAWLERLDPGTHRRIKGLRLITAYGIAAMLGMQVEVAGVLPQYASLGVLAGNFALWASVSEGRVGRGECSRDLVLLCAAAVLGALSYVVAAPYLSTFGPAWPEAMLASGAFAVGYLRRFGILGAGVGSQVYIGQLMAYGVGLTGQDVWAILAAGAIASVAAVVPLYAGFLVVMAGVGVVAARVARLDVAGARALTFSGATRNSLVVLPLALAVPGAIPILPAVIVTQTLVELLSELLYVRLIPSLGRLKIGTPTPPH